MAKAALEMAVWELHARREGLPLYRVLGGRGGQHRGRRLDRAAAGRRALVERVEAEARGRATGASRSRSSRGSDRDLVAAVRARFPELPLMVDANSAYTLADAAALRRRWTRYGLMMIEQPLAWDDIVDHAALQRRIRTPLCLDESIRSAARRAPRAGPRAPAG